MTGTVPAVRPSAARILMLPIRAWRLLSVHLPPRCRFHPSCSAYALEALATHGAVKGGWLAVRRVGRCHPWQRFGLDPVPLRRTYVRTDPPAPSVRRPHADPTT